MYIQQPYPNYTGYNYCPCCGKPLGYNPWATYGPLYNEATNSVAMVYPQTVDKKDNQ